jgi:predicted ATP-grasp superfamily ATP-dependent carboligase
MVKRGPRHPRDGSTKLMEINPNQAQGCDSKLGIMAGFAGWSYGRMLAMVIEAAIARLAADRHRQPTRSSMALAKRG